MPTICYKPKTFAASSLALLLCCLAGCPEENKATPWDGESPQGYRTAEFVVGPWDSQRIRVVEVPFRNQHVPCVIMYNGALSCGWRYASEHAGEATP